MMEKIKINPRFEKFSPKKKPDEIDELRESLKKKGYVGAPILTWHGFIVDGHNRYKMCKELGIYIDPDKNVEEIDLGENAEEIDAMDWMLTHQLSSKNLSAGEKLAMTEEFKKEVALENEMKKSKAIAESNKTRNPNTLQLECNEIQKNRSETWTDNQTAKKAGVGLGTVARYNRVMNSDDEGLKEKVKTGEITVNKAYTEVRNKNTKVCKVCGKRKKNNEFYVDDDVCMDCRRKEADEHINDIKFTSKPSEEIRRMCENAMTAKDAKDIDPDTEIRWLKEICNDFILRINNKFFDIIGAIEKFDTPHIQEAYDVFENFVSNVFDIQEKFNSKKENCDE